MAEGTSRVPVRRGADSKQSLVQPPRASLQHEINRLFDEFDFGRWPLPRSLFGADVIERARAGAPAVDIAETDKAFEVTAELPGMEEKDVEVELTNGDLRIKGEKKEQREEKNKDYYLSERSYGAFERRFRIPDGVDASKIEATVKNGVLTVTLPKTVAAPAQKIEVKKV